MRNAIAAIVVVVMVVALTVVWGRAASSPLVQRLRSVAQATQPVDPLAIPTDADPVGELRAEASNVAHDAPELMGPEIVPTLTALLSVDDAEVRIAAAGGIWRIANSAQADASGLRAAAQSDSSLYTALQSTASYTSDLGFQDEEARVTAIQALLSLDYPDGKSESEALFVDLYWRESSRNVLATLLAALCYQEYGSQETIDVLEHAQDHFDTEVAAFAEECREALP